MPALVNDRHEQFCRNVASGYNGATSARQAGFSGKAVAVTASRLMARPEIAARIAELRAEAIVAADANSVNRGASDSANAVSPEAKEIASASAARVITELGHLAYSDITDVVDGNVPFLADLKALPEHVRRSISSIRVRSVTRTGKDGASTTETNVEVKLWDKPAGLRMLGQHHALFKEVVENRDRTIEDELDAAEREGKAA